MKEDGASLPLTRLAPGLVEAILDGRQPKGLRLAGLLGNGPFGWEEQRRYWLGWVLIDGSPTDRRLAACGSRLYYRRAVGRIGAMTETQQIVTMVFGAAVAVAGIALMFFGRSENSRNHVKLLGMEFELSTPALAVFLVGSGLFVLPHFLPRADTPQSVQSMPPPPEPSSTF